MNDSRLIYVISDRSIPFDIRRFKSQGDAQRIALGYNDFFLDLTAKERYNITPSKLLTVCILHYQCAIF